MVLGAVKERGIQVLPQPQASSSKVNSDSGKLENSTSKIRYKRSKGKLSTLLWVPAESTWYFSAQS
jgi:hypothetical protein